MTTTSDDVQYGLAFTDEPTEVIGPVPYETALRKISEDRSAILMSRDDKHSPWEEAPDPPAAFVYMPVNRDLWEHEEAAREYLRGQLRDALAEKVREFGFVPDGEERELAAQLSDPFMVPTVLVKLSVPVRRP